MCKKRHIGNDLLAVVFLEDEDTVFSPSLIQSHFLHSYIVVQLVKGSTQEEPKYRVSAGSCDLHMIYICIHICGRSCGVVFTAYGLVNSVRSTGDALA